DWSSDVCSSDLYERAVSVYEAFVSGFPDHAASPDFLAQSVSYWQLAGSNPKALAARDRYVQRLGADARFQALSPEQKALWEEYSRFLADHYYAAGTDLSSRNQTSAASEAWAKAAHYYRSEEHT